MVRTPSRPALFALIALLASTADAATFDGISVLPTPSEMAGESWLMATVAADGETAVVGHPWAECSGGTFGDCGGLWVYGRVDGAWSRLGRLTASDALSHGARLGASVAVRGDLIVAGSTDRRCTPGDVFQRCEAVYTFRRPLAGWADATETQRIAAPAAGETYGRSVAIGDGWIAVGAPSRPCPGNAHIACGAVYVHQASGTTLPVTPTAVLTVATATCGTGFGATLAARGEVLASATGNGTCGLIAVRPASGWVDASPLVLDQASGVFDSYFESVALDEDAVAFGIPHDTLRFGNIGGAVVVFERPAGGWAAMAAETALLRHPAPEYIDGLGAQVAFLDGALFASAPRARSADGTQYAGEVFAFEPGVDGWSAPSAGTRLSASVGGTELGVTALAAGDDALFAIDGAAFALEGRNDLALDVGALSWDAALGQIVVPLTLAHQSGRAAGSPRVTVRVDQPGLDLGAISIDGVACEVDTLRASCALAPFAVGEQRQQTMRIAPAVAGWYALRSAFISEHGDTDPSDTSSLDGFDVYTDLALAVTLPSGVKHRGDKLKFAFSVANQSSMAVGLPTVRFTLPIGFKFLDANLAGVACPPPAVNTLTVTCQVTRQSAGTTLTGWLRVKATAGGLKRLTAQLYSNALDSDQFDNSVTLQKRIR